ncbi:MAG TPA: UDP-N-acetylmuramate--L-alanine ligase [Planctomycetaceae bacterium]|nr:UDP-N-acetylmuramate--L-alanine ligase [Planctomycetaceae bacterium]
MVLAGPFFSRTPAALRERADRRVSSAHLVGVCGSGMKALAELLAGEGWILTGSDLQAPAPVADPLRKRGLRIHQGHQSDFLAHDTDVLIYSPAVGPENPERQQAAALGIPQYSYNEMLGRLMSDKRGVCVAGTHGKSTTTAMTACVLESAGLSPSAVIGAEVRGRRANGWAGDGDLFVVESCEYQRNFLHLRPELAAILSIEPDHFDYFGSFDETIAAFHEFAQLVPADGLLVIREDCPAAHAACRDVGANIETFSLQPGADWWAADLRPSGMGVRFRVFHRGEYFAEMALQIPGEHSVLNALAALALCHRAGASVADIREGLREFAGIRRRFEVVGSWRGATLVDDYAHHPTAIGATLKTAREVFESRKIWCVFQPHQVSRTRALMDDFAASFGAADEVLITPVYGAREQYQNELSECSQILAERIAAHGCSARFTPSLDRLISTLEDEVQPGHVLMTMGAGDIDQVHYAFTRRLQRHYPPR